MQTWISLRVEHPVSRPVKQEPEKWVDLRKIVPQSICPFTLSEN